MSQQKPLSELTDSAMSNLRTLVDVNTIIGDPINTSSGIVIIPFSKVSFGYGTGGSDLPVNTPEKFAGGSGGGVTIQPLGFLVINKEDVKVIQIEIANNTGDRLVNAGAGVVDKILGMVATKTGKNKIAETEDEKDGIEPDGIALSPNIK